MIFELKKYLLLLEHQLLSEVWVKKPGKAPLQLK